MIGANGQTVFLIGDNRRLIPMGPDTLLIAAAPELLDALRDAQQALAHAIYILKDDVTRTTSIALNRAEDKAQAAIAKATGEPQ